MNFITKDIKKNKEEIINLFNNSSDLLVHEFETLSKINMMICYIEGLIDSDILDRDILTSLKLNLKNSNDVKNFILTSKVNEIQTIDEAIEEILYGKVILFAEGLKKAYSIEISKWEKRQVEEPQSEAVVKGPKEGFIEDISVNKVLLRRKLRNKDLIFEDIKLGQQTNTIISISYIKGIVNEEILNEVKRRLDKIDIDSILAAGYIEGLIEDSPNSLISTITTTEKPDVVAAKILEGRVAIFIDGTPHVLTMPRLFVEGFMSSEDYYTKQYYGSFLRLLRVLSFFITIYLPGTIVALQLYHQEMIPTVLLIDAAAAREGVPLPITIEVVLMIIVLELTKESGLRLPRNVGSAVTIVGTLVLGQAAVEAGLVGALTVIVVSITALCEYIIPQLSQGLIIYRIIVTLLGGFFGIYGITCAFVIITIQIVSLKSFGIPYAWPIAPMDKTGLKDTIVKPRITQFIYRPKVIAKQNVKRQVPPEGE